MGTRPANPDAFKANKSHRKGRLHPRARWLRCSRLVMPLRRRRPCVWLARELVLTNALNSSATSPKSPEEVSKPLICCHKQHGGDRNGESVTDASIQCPSLATKMLALCVLSLYF